MKTQNTEIEKEFTKAEIALSEAGQLSISGSDLLFLTKLFKAGEITFHADDKGFGFRYADYPRDFYPIELYEDGHWDNSLNQSLGLREREQGTKLHESRTEIGEV